MGDFKDSSLWLKLALLLTALAFGLDLFGMDVDGWTRVGYFSCGSNRNSRCDWYTGVEACEVVAFLALLVALFLVLCLVFLDELKGNKPALICYVVFALVAGIAAVIGMAIYGASASGFSGFSVMITCMAGLCAILGGIFGILELAGVSA